MLPHGDAIGSQYNLNNLIHQVLENVGNNHRMKKIGLAVLFGVFASAIACVSAGRLYRMVPDPGQLTMHRKMPLGPDAVTYSSDPVGFLIEFDLYLFLLVTGTLGILIACRDVLLEAQRPSRSFFGLDRVNQLITVFRRFRSPPDLVLPGCLRRWLAPTACLAVIPKRSSAPSARSRRLHRPEAL